MVQRCVKEFAALSKMIQKLYTTGVQEYMIHFKKPHASNTQKHLKQEDEEGSSEPPPCRREQWMQTMTPLCTWDVCIRLCHLPSPQSLCLKASVPLVSAPLQTCRKAPARQNRDSQAAASSLWKEKDCFYPHPGGMRCYLCRELLTWEYNGNFIFFRLDSLSQPYCRSFLAYMLICIG